MFKQVVEFISRGRMPRKDKAILRAFRLRPGMWVKFQGEVGVLTRLEEMPTTPDPHGAVMITDSVLGLNRYEVTVPLSALTQADYKEIPEMRRKDLTKDRAAAMGYF